LNHLTFVKLGGSVITDKNLEATAHLDVLRRFAREVAAARAARPQLRLVLGHGSGSFGHFVGHRYRTQLGLPGGGGWEGYIQTSAAAGRLNRIVTDIFLEEGLPVVSVQPSASARCRAGDLITLDALPVRELLTADCIPIVYGDVCLDAAQGFCIISTETIFAYLAHRLRPERILLLGMVDGVFTADPFRDPGAVLLPEITSDNLADVECRLGGSHGIDVTGGMWTKVRDMYALAQALRGLRIQIISGQRPGLLEDALLHSEKEIGTVIRG
jgi:isopentenyl phosphate kinase